MSDVAGGGPSRTMVVGSIVLGVMILVAFVLVLLLVMQPPGTTMRLAIGPGIAEPCPIDSGGTACYRFEVANTGQGDGVATCDAVPAPGTQAVFANGAPTVDVRLEAGEIKGVYIRVTPAEGGDQVPAPIMDCQV